MSEVAALNVAWTAYAKRNDIPQALYWDDGMGRRYRYATKLIYDRGWQAAMEWIESNA